MRKDDQKGDVFNTSKRIVKTNLDDGVLAVSDDEDMKTASKSHHEKLLNTEFAWDRNDLTQTETVTSETRLTDTVMF